MGILNVTPDSFSDGGRFNLGSAAFERAAAMLAEGADIIDIGGESTRPGAAPVSVQEELDRVIPVVESIAGKLDTLISVDTSSPEVMLAAAAAGAHLLNDVRALQRSGALEAAARTGLPVCLMHMQGEPQNMQANPEYEDVTEEVYFYLARKIQQANQAGIGNERLLIDPGFGFGKSLEHNLQLLANLKRFKTLGLPLLVGMSRKSMIGALTGKSVPAERVQGSVAAAVIAAMHGAHILRVHDVKETADALKIVAAVKDVMV
ncbi:MAG: dihydropteroate synthase [Oceanospirillaceae bacterium]|nr:dihydropteroate synthase [Oceanospirillaceae bacterium]